MFTFDAICNPYSYEKIATFRRSSKQYYSIVQRRFDFIKMIRTLL